ncbi:hypothetical protein V6Z11_A05G211400 [Gossypium hirsutum]
MLSWSSQLFYILRIRLIGLVCYFTGYFKGF